MLKIVFVTQSLGAGGAERVISNLSNEFIKKGYTVEIIKLAKGINFYPLDEKIRVHSVEDDINNIRGFKKIKTFLKTRSLIKRLNPDIIISLPEEIAIYLLLFCIGLRKTIIVSERNNPYVMPYKKITRIIRKISYIFAKGFVFQTADSQKYFSKKIQNKSTIIANPIDTRNLPGMNKGARKKEIVGIGRLVSQKNFKLLIESFYEVNKVYPDFTLGIYGEGPLEEELKKTVKNLLIQDKVTFYGKTPNLLSEIYDKYMYVLSSDYEGMPNSLIECMALGLPCISTDCPIGGPKSLIINDINGLLIPVNDKEAMVNSILRLIKDKELYDKISDEAFKIRETLKLEVISQKWLDFIRKVYNKDFN